MIAPGTAIDVNHKRDNSSVSKGTLEDILGEPSQKSSLAKVKPLGLAESLTPKGQSYKPTMFSRKRESYSGVNTGKAAMPHGIQSPYLP